MIDQRNYLVLFPTVAYRDHELSSWIANIHGWCFDAEEANFQRATAALLRRALKLPRDEEDPPFFRERCYGFVVENRKKISIEVSHNQGSFLFQKSKRNGHFRGVLDLLLEEIPAHVTHTDHGSMKTSISAKRGDNGIEVCGDIHLIGDRGLSIISDIDDTIKFTNVSDKQEMLRNSFLRPYQSIDGMADLFSGMANRNTSFHYISATPWQLYQPIAGFLKDHHFPEGSIHLRKFTLKDITFLKKIFPVHKKKKNVILTLITQYPRRRFILFGDSGERDPEIYGEIAQEFPKQISGICIRNTSASSPDSSRFRKAFKRFPKKRWVVFDDAMSLQKEFLPKILESLPSPDVPL